MDNPPSVPNGRLPNESAASAKPQPPQWQSSDLLRGQREAWILHEGQTYRLVCTRNGKLILQK